MYVRMCYDQITKLNFDGAFSILSHVSKWCDIIFSFLICLNSYLIIKLSLGNLSQIKGWLLSVETFFSKFQRIKISLLDTVTRKK